MTSTSEAYPSNAQRVIFETLHKSVATDLTPDELGLAIKEARERLGLNQAELAQRSGLSRAFISDIENGKSSVRLAKLMRLLRYIGIQVRYTLSLEARMRMHDLADAARNGP